MKKDIFSQAYSAPLFEKIEKLAKWQRALILAGFFLVLIGIFAYFFYLPKLEQLEKSNKDLKSLNKQLISAKEKARLLKKYTAEMEKAEADFRLAMKKLPEKKEIPTLLATISQSGQDAGLGFLLFRPGGEVRKNFYAEIPVSIKVRGTYHQNAQFFDKLSKLDRIVNVRNIVMKPEKKQNQLTTTCTAVTYKFVEPKKKNDKKKTQKRRKKR